MTAAAGQDMEALRGWLGRFVEAEDEVSARTIADYAATMDWDMPQPKPGDPVPPGAHWFFFHDQTRQSELDRVGLPKRGDFLPPVDLPRRMNAGNRISFRQPLRVGERITCKTEIADITEKTGSTGRLVFVVMRNTVSGENGPAVVDDRTIVYREAAKPSDGKREPRPAPDDAAWEQAFVPDPVVMFRFSALTFNASRIHYDYKYVTEEEGYPGLIVNARLTTALLMDFALRQNPGAELAEVSTKFVRPLYDFAPFTLAGKPNGDGDRASMWVADPDGALAMTCDLRFA